MTYLEIIEWIGEHLDTVEHCSIGIDISYFEGELQMTCYGKDLISIVLEINNKELVK